MKTLSHFGFEDIESFRKGVVYLRKSEGGNALLEQINNLSGSMDQSPLIQGEQEKGGGILPSETAESIQNQVSQTIEQGSEVAQKSALSGKWKVGRFTPENLVGLGLSFEKTFLSPLFWGQTIGNPKQVAIEQVKSSMNGDGNPTKLLANSPLLSDKTLSGLLGSSVDSAIHAIEMSGGGDLEKVSLTSLEFAEGVFETRHRLAQDFLAEQRQDFLEKVDNEQWWAKSLRLVGGFQKQRYKGVLKLMKRNETVGHKENIGIIQGLKQKKEQALFEAKQPIDRAFISAENTADTERLEYYRRTINRIFNNPEAFLQNPGSLEETIPLSELFGRNFNPLDVLDALKRNNYLDAAIKVNHWQLSHYNALQTINSAGVRVEALKKFDGQYLETLETHVNKRYEPSENGISLNNPQIFVNEIIGAIGSATPGLLQNLNEIIKANEGNIYMGSMEVFWHLANFLGEKTEVFDKLPPNLQQKFAQFFLQKRSQLEESLISGGLNEAGTFIWRAKALNLGNFVLDSSKEVVGMLPGLGEDLLSLDKGVAQDSLRKIKTLSDNYEAFTSFLGITDPKNTNGSLFDKLPEFEQGILNNVIALHETIEKLEESRKNLHTNRNKFEELIDQSPEWVKSRQDEYNEKQALLHKLAEKGKTGFEDASVSVLAPGMGGHGGAVSGEEGEMTGAGGGIETAYTAIRKDLQRLQGWLMDGADGGSIGKVQKLEAHTYDDLTGDISKSLESVTSMTQKLIENRFKELGITDSNDLDFLTNEAVKPKFKTLAELELGQIATRDILATANTLLQNDTAQQFKNMEQAQYNAIEELVYISANYQQNMTVNGLVNPSKIKNALYARKDSDGSIWYHTETQVIRITPPGLKQEGDQRNISIWHKDPAEKGFKRFTVPYTHPDELGIMLTANPENSAAKDNPYYGIIGQKIAHAKGTQKLMNNATLPQTALSRRRRRRRN